MDSASCYGGGDIAGTFFGTLFGCIVLAIVLWWIYKKYWKNRKGTHLVEDPENAKTDFAFDNPAFKGEQNKTTGLAPALDNNNRLSGGRGGGGGGGVGGSSSGSQLSADKRKTFDDSYANVPKPRIVALRGSDFTGLGVEVAGGLKEGIYVKKIMPQGPAAGKIDIGDKITSITIDFQHIVQEDAATILSYASPYNVQLEIVDGKGTLPLSIISQSPPSQMGAVQQSLTHPLYRSSSQEDFNTIERNARKKLFPTDDSNYPTLKMEQQTNRSQSPTKNITGTVPPSTTTMVHKENEKKNSFKQQFKDLIEEKLQTKNYQNDHQTQSQPITQQQQQQQQTTTVIATVNEKPAMNKEEERKSSSSISPDGNKKGLKFGIRVLPPNVNEKQFGVSAAVSGANNNNNNNNSNANNNNENNINVEKQTIHEMPSENNHQATTTTTTTTVITSEKKSSPPPPISKRTKAITNNNNKIDDPKLQTEMINDGFQRQIDVTSSGIRRDENGIPQELPNHMIQAAMAAKDNRKTSINIQQTVVESDSAAQTNLTKSKGKAPRPPPPSSTQHQLSTSTNELPVQSMKIITDRNVSGDNSSAIDNLDVTDSSTLNDDKLNFTDNFVNELFNKSAESPIHLKFNQQIDDDLKKHPINDKQQQQQQQQQHIEVNSNHIIIGKKTTLDDGNQSDDNADESEQWRHKKFNGKLTPSIITGIDDVNVSRRQTTTANNNGLNKHGDNFELNANSSDSVGNGDGMTNENITITTVETTTTKITPKKRKATKGLSSSRDYDNKNDGDDDDDDMDFSKEPRLMMDKVSMGDNNNKNNNEQRGRLKSAYEWGNLEDAIYDNKLSSNVTDGDNDYADDDDDDDDEIDLKGLRKKHNSDNNISTMTTTESNDSSINILNDVMAAADRFDDDDDNDDADNDLKMVKDRSTEGAGLGAGNKIKYELLDIRKSKIDEPKENEKSNVIATKDNYVLIENVQQQQPTHNATNDTDTIMDKFLHKEITDATKRFLENELYNNSKFDNSTFKSNYNIYNLALQKATSPSPPPPPTPPTPPPRTPPSESIFKQNVDNYDAYNHITIEPIQLPIKKTTTTINDSHNQDNDRPLMNSAAGNDLIPRTTTTTTTTIADYDSADPIKVINYGTNISDDVKVTRYPFGSLERPKSDVLKKLIAHQYSDDIIGNNHNNHMPSSTITSQTTTTTTTNIINPTSPPSSETITIENNYLESQPIHLSFNKNNDNIINLNNTNNNNNDTTTKDLTPVFSSDTQGVNSISISSMEFNIGPETRKDALPGILGLQNIVTISTDGSQPSSLMLIDDEKLDFTLRTLEEENNKYLLSTMGGGGGGGSGANRDFQIQTQSNGPPAPMTAINLITTETLPQPPLQQINNDYGGMNKDEVFVIESLSSKKMPEKLLYLNRPDDDDKDYENVQQQQQQQEIEKQTFVTEIQVQQPIAASTVTTTPSSTYNYNNINNNDHYYYDTLTNNSDNQKGSSTNAIYNFLTNNNNIHDQQQQQQQDNHHHNDDDHHDNGNNEYIPRNSEMKFTTSTYESTNNNLPRYSQIDQIRSNFEKNYNSEIPVPIRKSTTTSLSSSMASPQQQHQQHQQHQQQPHSSLSLSSSSASSTSSSAINHNPSSSSLRISPSKIPVFNSTKTITPTTTTTNNNNNNNINASEFSLTQPSQIQQLINKNNGNINRVNVVSVTSIKNSSRNPSGK